VAENAVVDTEKVRKAEEVRNVRKVEELENIKKII
jgi:hypothetical protein